jgi:hypothetical protein
MDTLDHIADLDAARRAKTAVSVASAVSMLSLVQDMIETAKISESVTDKARAIETLHKISSSVDDNGKAANLPTLHVNFFGSTVQMEVTPASDEDEVIDAQPTEIEQVPVLEAPSEADALVQQLSAIWATSDLDAVPDET